jgi:predicted nucleic acid-binding protein
MRIALDTNILAYAEGIDGPERRVEAATFVRRLQPDQIVIPVQVLGELFNVLTRKKRFSRAAARKAVIEWRDAFPTLVETSPDTMAAAVDLASDHDLGIWDAVIVCAASQAGCRLLASQDMHGGFTWGGVTIVDPFAKPPHPLLQALLAG